LGKRPGHPDIWPRLQPRYPTKNQLRRKFDFFWSVFDIKVAEIKEGSAPEVIEACDRARAELQAR
jgi:hypothetical protein